MNTNSKKSWILGLSRLAIAVGLVYSTSSLGQDSTTTAPKHKHGGRKFHRGVCVGQTLAQEGIILPAHQPGQRPVLDPATKAAFKAAVQACKAKSTPPTTTSGGSSS